MPEVKLSDKETRTIMSAINRCEHYKDWKSKIMDFLVVESYQVNTTEVRKSYHFKEHGAAIVHAEVMTGHHPHIEEIVIKKRLNKMKKPEPIYIIYRIVKGASKK